MNKIKLTKFQALFIAYLRIRCEGSWRWIAAKYYDRYKYNKSFNFEITVGGDQMDGLYLCREASEILGIEVEIKDNDDII